MPIKLRRLYHVARLLAAVLITCVMASALVGCSQETPEILGSEYRIRLIYDPESGIVRKDLALHLELETLEIANSIQELKVYTGDNPLLWDVSGEKLTITEQDERVWLGSNNLGIPASMLFPEGIYRVEVVNSRGEMAGTDIVLPRGELYAGHLVNPHKFFPSFNVREEESIGVLAEIKSPAHVLVRGYSADDQFLEGFYPDVFVLSQNSEAFSRLKEFAYFYLSYIDLDTGVELISGPFSLMLGDR